VNKKITRWPLDRLKPNPRQQELFSDLPAEAFKDLVENIRTKGLQSPVEILSDGTILCGHQRVRAAKELGWKEIGVWIRKDLESRGQDACEERLIEDNLLRRQVGGLVRARCLQRLKDIELSQPLSERRKHLVGDLRDVIARKLGCKGRNADRYLKVLETPVEVQNAFDRGELSLVNAGRVAGLAREDQEAIAARIGAGDSPKAVVAETFCKEKRRPPPSEVLFDLESALARCGPDLLEWMTEIKSISRNEYTLLHRGRDLLDALIEHAEMLAVDNGMDLTASAAE
jgi:ParB-like chromosome segregation protein Spo0J